VNRPIRCSRPPAAPTGGSYSRAVAFARSHPFLKVAFFAVSFALVLVFASVGRAEGTTVVTGDPGGTPIADAPVTSPSTDGSSVVDGASETTDPASVPPTDTVPPPDEAPPPDAPPTDTVPPPDAAPPPDAPPTDTVPPPDAAPPPDVLPPTDPVPPPDPVPTTDPGPGSDGSLPLPIQSLDGTTVAASPIPVSDALTAAVGGLHSSAASGEDPAVRSVRAASSSRSRGAPEHPRVPSDPTGPSAPASTPAGSGGAPGGSFFFSGFAALVAAVCVGVVRRNTKRLIMSVAVWEPVAFVSLPERPG
jgi:hypothetical protein